MSTNKQKPQKVADNDAATLGYLRKSDLSHKAEIQMLITLAEAHGIKMTYNEKDGEVTVERVEGLDWRSEGESQSVKESAQAQQSFAQMQRTPNQPPDLSGIDYVRLANALKEHVEKALQNAVESSPVHIQAIFDTSVHMENNQTAMTIAHEEWAKWMQAFGKETISKSKKLKTTLDITGKTVNKKKRIRKGYSKTYSCQFCLITLTLFFSFNLPFLSMSIV